MASYYHGLKALAHPRQAQKGFSRGSFEAYQHVLTAPAKQGTETLPWLLHGLDELEEHQRHSMSASVSEVAPDDMDGQAGEGGLALTTSTRNQVHFSVCIEQWRITQKIVGYQRMCAVCLFAVPVPLIRCGPGALEDARDVDSHLWVLLLPFALATGRSILHHCRRYGSC